MKYVMVCMQLGVRNACISRLVFVQINVMSVSFHVKYQWVSHCVMRYGMLSCEVSMADLVTGLVIHVDCANFVMGKWHNFHQTYQQDSSAPAQRNWSQVW